MQSTTKAQIVCNDSEAEAILQNLRALSDQVVTAWQERAVVLTIEEQSMLRREIHSACEMLSNLTHSI
jgi:phosphoribosylformylglycinamidine (FGAM) synthase PurS component